MLLLNSQTPVWETLA